MCPRGNMIYFVRTWPPQAAPENRVCVKSLDWQMSRGETLKENSAEQEHSFRKVTRAQLNPSCEWLWDRSRDEEQLIHKNKLEELILGSWVNDDAIAVLFPAWLLVLQSLGQCQCLLLYPQNKSQSPRFINKGASSLLPNPPPPSANVRCDNAHLGNMERSERIKNNFHQVWSTSQDTGVNQWC